MTGRDLVTASLRLIGAVAPGESLAAQEATDGLAALNRMLGSWSNQSLLIHAKVREEFTLTAATQTYTLGTGGTFNTTRPLQIESATIELQTSSPVTEVPMRILRSAREWAEIQSKEESTEIPQYLYAEGTFPLERIHLFPIPSTAHKVVLYSQKPLTEIATLDTAVSLPPGYDRALIFNLAVDLGPEYGRPVPDSVAMTAMDSRALLKRTNEKPLFLKVDSALRASRPFDIFRGDE